MKLRLHNDSVRLRLTRSEVTRLAAGQRVESTCHLLPDPLTVSLRPAPEGSPADSPITLHFHRGRLSIAVPSPILHTWATTDQISLSSTLPGSAPIDLLIEKDFHCLHGPPQDQEDTFPHPAAGAVQVPHAI